MLYNPPVLVALLGALSQAHPDTSRVEHQAIAMGSPLHVSISGSDRATALAAVGDVLHSVEVTEQLLSSWTDASELGAFNRSRAGMPVTMSPALLSVLVEVGTWGRRTGGAFDPGIGTLVDAWDLRGEGRIPDHEAVATARAASGIERFRFDVGTQTGTRPAAGWIDAGGFGKGLALRHVRTALARHGVQSARVNFGGQILVVGPGPDGSPWEIGIADPRTRGRAVAQVWVEDMSIATAGLSQRGVTVDGSRFGHVLDPRTGYPVSDWGSVTVLARDPMKADVLATALLVLGREAGLAWSQRNGVAAILVDYGETGVPRVTLTDAALPFARANPVARAQ